MALHAGAMISTNRAFPFDYIGLAWRFILEVFHSNRKVTKCFYGFIRFFNEVKPMMICGGMLLAH
jgi:hypothetical protein